MLSDLALKAFRSYADDAFEFGEGVNIIVGPNASGKTNLLEAILVTCTGSSYRAKDIDLIGFNQPWTRLESDTDEGKRVVTIERTDLTAKKKFSIAGNVQSRLSLKKTIPVVVFEPEHLRLLHGGPERRRDYVDNLLEQTTIGYSQLRREYRRTVAQRNKLLKSTESNLEDQLFVWNVRLSELGGKIVAYRKTLVDMLNTEIENLYNSLASTESQVHLEYETDCPIDNYSSSVLTLLSQNTEKDRMRGYTTNGPHRHDIVVVLNGHTAALSASRGETRTLLLALKIIEMRLLEKIRQKKPILLLDDVFSELDGKRRRALTTFLESYQTFITTTDADIVVQHFMDNCTIIPITRS